MSERLLSFTCPICGAVSYNENDILHRYCARCHVFTADKLAPNGQVEKIARRLSAEYREIAAELTQAANVLDKNRGEVDRLPVVQPSRFTEAMRLGIMLHYVADHTTREANE